MADVTSIIALVLGGIGTLTGLASLCVHILNYRKSKSVIEIEKRRAEINKKDKKITYTVMIHNKGNSPTTISRAEAVVDRPILHANRVDKYLMNVNIFGLKEKHIAGSGGSTSIRDWENLDIPFKLEPNSSIRAKIELIFIDEPSFKRIIEGPIKSEIVFYHTHGKTKRELCIGVY